MIERLNAELLLKTEDFKPTHPDFRVIGVFNPGVERVGDEIIMLVRIAQAHKSGIEENKWLNSPRSTLVDGEIQYQVDRIEIDPSDGARDHRKPLLVTGYRRLAFISHLEMVRLSPDGYKVREIIRHPELFGRTDWEEYGVEDPRITLIDGTYYITYVSVSGKMGVATSLMSTTDFTHFERHGVIFPCENKDVVLFPEKIGGRYYAFHRPAGHIDIRKLAILMASSPNLIDWGEHRFILGSQEEPGGWYSGKVGAGTPPVKTEEGWLSIFHGVRYRGAADPIGVYTAGAMLSALDEPERIVGISREPFFRAQEDYEVSGYVKDVVFPTGIVRDFEDEDKVHVFYGCADSSVAVTTFSVSEILASLQR